MRTQLKGGVIIKYSDISKLKRLYYSRFVLRCAASVICIFLLIYRKEQFNALYGIRFFDSFSLLHIIWVLWITDMLLKLFPVRNGVALGSIKHHRCNYRNNRSSYDKKALKMYVKDSSIRAYISMAAWLAMLAVFGVLYYSEIINAEILFLISTLFYVLDLVCVLFFCPFRILLNTRCCTTCRIFNWDSFFLISPLLFVKGFYSYSLLALAVTVFILWEVRFFTHPERFYDGTNESLKCAGCKDGLCRRDYYLDSIILKFFRKGK